MKCPKSVPHDGTTLVEFSKSLSAHRVCPAFGMGQRDTNVGQDWGVF